MTNPNSNKRIDTLQSQMHVLFSIHNRLLAYKAVAWEIKQEELAEYLKMGERTLQRITSDLEGIGRLSRQAGKGRNNYIYSIPKGAIEEAMLEMALAGNLFLIRSKEGYLSAVKDFETFMNTALINESHEE